VRDASGNQDGSSPQAAQPTDIDRAMMLRALDLARHAAAEREVPVGAIVYRTATGEELGTGSNRRENDRQPHAHAEFTAIVKACDAIGDWRLNECTLVVTLEPCPMCAGLIVNARVGRVVFAARDPKAGAVKSLMELLSDTRLNHRPSEIVEGVMAEESAALLKQFFRSLRSESGA
jgi:tRNA(adenine34) deaminase